MSWGKGQGRTSQKIVT